LQPIIDRLSLTFSQHQSRTWEGHYKHSNHNSPDSRSRKSSIDSGSTTFEGEEELEILFGRQHRKEKERQSTGSLQSKLPILSATANDIATGSSPRSSIDGTVFSSLFRYKPATAQLAIADNALPPCLPHDGKSVGSQSLLSLVGSIFLPTNAGVSTNIPRNASRNPANTYASRKPKFRMTRSIYNLTVLETASPSLPCRLWSDLITTTTKSTIHRLHAWI
jgi:hypothetical protein